MYATVIVVCGISIPLLDNMLKQDNMLSWSADIVFFCCFLVMMIISFFPHDQQRTAEQSLTLYRTKISNGIECCPLVPVAVFLANQSTPCNSEYYDLCVVWCLLSLITSLLSIFVITHINGLNESETGSKQWIGVISVLVCIAATPSAVYALSATLSTSSFAGPSFLILSLLVGIQLVLQLLIPRRLPRSFTCGEVTVIAQGTCYFVMMAAMQYIIAIKHITAVASCCLVILALTLVPCLRSTVRYYCLVLSVICGVSFPTLRVIHGKDVVSWLVNFILNDTRKLGLFVHWSVSCVISIGIVSLNACKYLPVDMKNTCHSRVQTESHSFKKEPCSTDVYEEAEIENKCYKVTPLCRERLHDTKNRNNFEKKSFDENSTSSFAESSMNERHTDAYTGSISTSARKQFHILAIWVFLPGLLIDAEMTCMAASCGLVVLVMIESLRLLHIPPFGDLVSSYFQRLVDEKDEGLIFLTHIYLLAGMTIPLWLHTSNNMDGSIPLALFAGLISVGVGDTMASVFGSAYGRHKWIKGGKKSIEGSLASAIAQLIFTYLMMRVFRVYCTITWARCVTSMTLVTLLEAFTDQIDNLVLPLFLYIMLI